MSVSVVRAFAAGALELEHPVPGLRTTDQGSNPMSFIREPNSEPIPGYRLIEPLGSGGFGEVWKCEAPGGLHKAIKFVFGNLGSLGDEAAPAEQEKKALD